MAFLFFITFLIFLRLAELVYSRRNETWLRQQDAIEYGRKHYPYMIAIHTMFIISLIAEYSLAQSRTFSLALFLAYCLSLAIKLWVILSLGKFWSTKIYRIPEFPLVQKGLYKYIKHPNYMLVVIEIALIPLVFHLYFTAIVFTVLNAMILFVRIKEENRALEI